MAIHLNWTIAKCHGIKTCYMGKNSQDDFISHRPFVSFDKEPTDWLSADPELCFKERLEFPAESVPIYATYQLLWWAARLEYQHKNHEYRLFYEKIQIYLPLTPMFCKTRHILQFRINKDSNFEGYLNLRLFSSAHNLKWPCLCWQSPSISL